SSKPDRAVLDAMSRSIAHRGPDDDGSFVDAGLGLAVRRLSIIDVEGGHQPISNEDGSLWIVFNGEIYNHESLRQLLAKLGHRFQTRADTEVVVHAYEEFGADAVRYLNGMFAFAIWDARARKLFLARDRFGIKPLYYTLAGDELIFASELKAILAHPRVERRIDFVALNEYLSFEYVPTPRTIFRDIRKLPPAHTLTYSVKGPELSRYWDLSLRKSESRPPVSWREYRERLRHELAEAVRKEMVSDVPLGVLLSGGLDSTTVLAMMARSSERRVKSFSIAFEEKSFDESRFARLAATKLGSEHHELTVTSSMMAELVPRLMDVIDEPFADSSIVPTYFLSRFAREQVKVVLGGDGGDEMFAGYPTLQAHRVVEYYEGWVPFFLRATVVPRIIDRLPVSKDNISFDFKARRFISGRGVPVASRHHRWLGAFVPQEKRSLFVPELVQDDVDTYEVAYEHQRHCDARETMNQLLYLDQKLYLEGDILTKVDRASMAASLEVRVPFLNASLAEYVAEIPHGLKLRGLTTKFVLKKAMAGLVPAEILNRPKKGFNVPVGYWIEGSLRELVRDQLAPEKLKREGFFEPAYVEKLLREHAQGVRDHRKLLWTLLVFELWQEKYLRR
ncbi:MAG TPA: asparagine synthase (glutamine-hydrolyzing), partial [Vicinamibacteria bacterium]|nr:asparagine synthase (glutamine-hydrolyzing) [Vicinamibacteria bacterium]